METKEHVIVNKSILNESFLSINDRVENLFQQNLLAISEQNKVELVLPITKSTIIMLCAAYKFKIPVITITALYQVYYNDLLVIILTLLQSIDLLDSIKIEYANILENLQHKEKLEMTKNGEILYQILKTWQVDDKLYLPINLW